MQMPSRCWKKIIKKSNRTFAKYEDLGPHAYVGKKKLANEICAELTLHTQLEEEILYPAFRENLSDEKALVNEAKVEHDSAKVLIKEIQQMEADEELFDAKVKVLSEYIDHHVKERRKTNVSPNAKKWCRFGFTRRKADPTQTAT